MSCSHLSYQAPIGASCTYVTMAAGVISRVPSSRVVVSFHCRQQGKAGQQPLGMRLDEHLPVPMGCPSCPCMAISIGSSLLRGKRGPRGVLLHKAAPSGMEIGWLPAYCCVDHSQLCSSSEGWGGQRRRWCPGPRSHCIATGRAWQVTACQMMAQVRHRYKAAGEVA